VIDWLIATHCIPATVGLSIIYFPSHVFTYLLNLNSWLYIFLNVFRIQDAFYVRTAGYDQGVWFKAN